MTWRVRPIARAWSSASTWKSTTGSRPRPGWTARRPCEAEYADRMERTHPPAARPAGRGRGEGDVLRRRRDRPHPPAAGARHRRRRARGRVARLGPPPGPSASTRRSSATTCGRARTRWSRRPARRWSASAPRRSASGGGPAGRSTCWPRRASSTTRRSSRCGTTATACRTPRGRRSWPRASRARSCELPPATYRVAGPNLPVAGGGYFRLFPLGRDASRAAATRRGPTRRWACCTSTRGSSTPTSRGCRSAGSRGGGPTSGSAAATARLGRLLARYAGRFRRATDVVADLRPRMDSLPRFRLATAGVPVLSVECSPATP